MEEVFKTCTAKEDRMKFANYLENLLACKKGEIQQLIQDTQRDPQHHLNRILHQEHICQERFLKALKSPGLSIIGEIKRESPTCGKIRHIDDPATFALQYCQGGASAISVLTDMQGFGGSLKDMHRVSKILNQSYPEVAILRKDFILHSLQLAEAVFYGAHAVLLIVGVVGSNLKSLLQDAQRLGLDVLTEVHDLPELELALEAGAKIIGMNHRNLKRFTIDLEVSEKLKPYIPEGVVTVAESGIHNPMQAEKIRKMGCDGILIGEALVKAQNPSQLIKQMKGETGEDEG